jgi:hypothetical protein
LPLRPSPPKKEKNYIEIASLALAMTDLYGGWFWEKQKPGGTPGYFGTQASLGYNAQGSDRKACGYLLLYALCAMPFARSVDQFILIEISLEMPGSSMVTP